MKERLVGFEGVVETRFGAGRGGRGRELIAVSREIRCRIFIRILFRLPGQVSCTSGVMRWHLVRLVGVSPASFHTFNLYNGVQRRGEGGKEHARPPPKLISIVHQPHCFDAHVTQPTRPEQVTV